MEAEGIIMARGQVEKMSQVNQIRVKFEEIVQTGFRVNFLK